MSKLDVDVCLPVVESLSQTIWKLKLIQSLLPQRQRKQSTSSGDGKPKEGTDVNQSFESDYRDSDEDSNEISIKCQDGIDQGLQDAVESMVNRIVSGELDSLDEEGKVESGEGEDGKLSNTKEESTQTEDGHRLSKNFFSSSALFYTQADSNDEEKETELTANVLLELSFRKLNQDITFIGHLFERLHAELHATGEYGKFSILVIDARKNQNKKSEYIAMYHAQKWKARNFERSTHVRSLKNDLDVYIDETQLLIKDKESEILERLRELKKARLKLPTWKAQEKKISQVKKEKQRFILHDEELPIQEKIDVLSREEPQELKAHAALTTFLHKSIGELEITLKEWQEKVLRDTQEKTEAKIKCEDSLHTQEEALSELDVKYAEYEGIVEEYLRQKRTDEAKQKQEQKLVRSATKIQAWWRGMRVRTWGAIGNMAAAKRKMSHHPKHKKGKKT